ncbi:MAG: hypothetical protein CL566_00370 [Alphaproteobacteria bacterium]|nr:hypothetical protein [Alphaproteobacteria bacterium]
MDPLDIPSLLPQVILLDGRRGPWDFRFRLIGTNVVYLLASDLTGHGCRKSPTCPRPAGFSRPASKSRARDNISAVRRHMSACTGISFAPKTSFCRSPATDMKLTYCWSSSNI